MRTLNRTAAESLQTLPAGAVHACTDVTGFSLMGHGSEMAVASGVTLVIDANRVPAFPGVLAFAAANRSAGMASNQAHFGHGVRMDVGVGGDLECLLYDPQTSGGLLVAVAPEAAERALAGLIAAGVPAVHIGSVVDAVPGINVVVR